MPISDEAVKKWLDRVALTDAHKDLAVTTGAYAANDSVKNRAAWLKAIETLAQAEHVCKS